MDIFSVLSMIGGLAMFLYGMETMGDGLAKTAGGKLEHILEKLTSTPIKGVLLGAAVTAVIRNDGHGRRIRKLRHYETVTGSWYHHGCQYRYDGHILDRQSFRH